MKLFFSTRQAARDFAAKVKVNKPAAKVVDNFKDLSVPNPSVKDTRYGVDLRPQAAS